MSDLESLDELIGPDGQPATLSDIVDHIAEKLAQAKQETLMFLARTVEGKLQERMGTRKAKENQMLEALRLYLGSLASFNVVTGEYPFGVQDKSIVHRPETNIVRVKCETAIAQTMAYQFAAGDKNWDLRMPQSFELDSDDMQMIQQMAAPNGPQLTPEQVMLTKIDLMEREMETHLENTSYGIECRKAGWDRVVLGTGVMKGPTNATKLRKTYVKQKTSDGRTIRVPQMVPESVPCIYRVNPWYFFPDDTVTDIKDAEDCIEVHPMSSTQLGALTKNPAFDAESILACLEEKPRQYINSPFNDPAYLTQGINLLKDRYLVVEYHGPMKEEDIKALGKSPTYKSPTGEYFMEIWVCNSRVIRAEFSNIDGCYRCPYTVSTWEPDPATMFGFGVPMLVRDQQRVVNETFHMMLDNAGVSAGPQVVVDTTLIKPAQGGLECTPWKVWYANEYGADLTKAISFFMPQNAFEGLSAMFQLSMGLADNESSIPNLSINMGAPTGAGDSATGMAIAQQQAASPLFYKSEQWDDCITKPLLEMLYDWEMQYNPKDEIKGVFDIDVRTSTAMLQSALNQQKLERLSMEVAQGSPIAEFINLDELAEARLLDMHLPYKGIVKTMQQVAQERANRPPPPPDPNLIKAQAEQAKVEVDKARVDLEQQRFQLESQLKYAEVQIQARAQELTDNVRAQEAQASVLKARYDYMAQMAALAQKDEIDRAKILAEMHMDEMDLQTTRFLAGITAAQKAKDQELTQQELKIKKQKGTGI